MIISLMRMLSDRRVKVTSMCRCPTFDATPWRRRCQPQFPSSTTTMIDFDFED